MSDTPTPVISTEQVERQCGGVAPYLAQLGAEQGPAALLDATWAAQADFERQTRVLLSTKKVVMNPRAEWVQGEDYDLEESPHPYHHVSQQRLIRLVAKWRPIQEILSFRVEFNRDNTLITIPVQWERVNKRLGYISVVPYQIAAAMGVTAGAALGLSILANWGFPGDAVPAMIAFDFTAGYTDCDTAPDKADIRQCLGWMAAANVMRDLPRLIPNSGSGDGFTQSFDGVLQQAESLEKRAEKFIVAFMRRERPLVTGLL